MENRTIFEKQANEIDTRKEVNSKPGTSEPATISSINYDFLLEHLSEDELRVVHKHIFLQIFIFFCYIWQLFFWLARANCLMK